MVTEILISKYRCLLAGTVPLYRGLICKLLKSAFEPIANRSKAFCWRVCCMQQMQSDWTILGALTKLRKETINFVTSVRPSFRSHGTTRLPPEGFSWNLTFEYFRKSVGKIQVSLHSDKNIGFFTWRPNCIFDNISVISSKKEEYFRQKLQRKAKHIFYVQ
jgi:hypothetical protein